MTQHNDDQKQQPWDASFDEKQDEEVVPSRTQLRKRSTRTTLIVSLLILAVIVLAAYPIFRYVQSVGSQDSATEEPVQTQVSTSKPSESTSEKADKSDDTASQQTSSQAAASSRAIESSQAAVSSQAAAQLKQAESDRARSNSLQSASAASSRAIESSQAAASSSAAASSNSTGQYATVTVNAYRLALAHGLSLGELQTLNPGVNLNNVGIGTQLRIK